MRESYLQWSDGYISKGIGETGVHLKTPHDVAVYVFAECILVLWRPNPEGFE